MIVKILFYPVKLFLLGLFISFCRIRLHNLSELKDVDNSIIISNHQSYLDPILISLCLPYVPIFIARKTLLNSKLLNVMLRMVKDLIFIDREDFSISSFKGIVSKLQKNRKAICLYPEGTRSLNGKISKFKKGFALISSITSRNIHIFYIKDAYHILGKSKSASRLLFPISIYYLKKYNYNTSPSVLCKEINEYYRRFEETIHGSNRQ